MVKNKKGQNSQMFLVIGAILMLVISGFAFSGGSSSSDEREETTKVPDNTANLDESASDYVDREDYVGNDEDILTITNPSDSDKGDYNVTKDTNDENNLIITNTESNESINMTKSNLEKYVGKLQDSENVVKFWFNNNYDVNGFTRTFQAFLIYDDSWNKYKVLWSIENENFVVKDLKVQDKNDLTPYFNKLNNENYDLFFVKKNGDTYKDISSLVFTNSEGDLFISKSLGYTGGSCGNGCRTKSFYTGTLSNNAFSQNVGLYTEIISTHATIHNNVFQYFSINEYKDYSYDRIAQLSNTRTTGFNDISFIKQEKTAGINTMEDKRLTLLSKEKYTEVLDYANNQNRLNSFVVNNANELLSVSNDSAISLFGANNDYENWVNYGIGEADSEDIEGIVGIDLEGYISDVTDSEFIEVTNIKFNPENSYGLRMSDLGLSTIQVTESEGSLFGKISMDNVNSSAKFIGTARVIDTSKWQNAYASLVNIFDFSFSWSIWWDESTTNSKFGLSEDIVTDCDIVTGCEYGYTGSFKSSGTKDLTLTTGKPVTELLSYDDKNYWLFWTLDTRSENNEGCLIFDHTITNIDVTIPVSICDNKISGANAFAQFKIFSEE